MSKRLKIKRFLQHPAECAVASAASITNFYNKKIDYDKVRLITEDMLETEVNDGLYDGEIGVLLNLLGFKSVNIISTDLDCFDYSWKNLSKQKIVENLKHMSRVNTDYRENCKSMVNFLTFNGYKNKLTIDYAFGKYIREYLDTGSPVMISFNWTTFLRIPKFNDRGENDAFKGSVEIHAVVACGYDEKGVYIVDSHNSFYKYKLKKYKNGRYRFNWEDLMVVMGCTGNVIVPMEYNKDLIKYEF